MPWGRRRATDSGSTSGDHTLRVEFRSSLVMRHNNFGLLLSETGEPEEAEAQYQKALAIRQKLAEENVLRGRDDFKLMMADLDFPREPFAK